MSGISYLICAAGLGQRMKSISETTPKPLLRLDGKTLLQHSLESLPLAPGDELVFLHRFSGDDEQTALDVLERQAARHTVRSLPLRLERLTAGQAETALAARDTISNQRIAIYNTDTFFSSRALAEGLGRDDFDGLAPCARAPGDQWSFFKTDGGGLFRRASEVREKQRISEWCSTGFYYFKNADDLFSEVENELRSGNLTRELYVAPYYNRLIERGQDIRVVDCEEFKPMGTPEQVRDFWNISTDEFKRENT